MNNFYYKNKWLYPTRIILNLTDNCNLACRYCFVKQHPNFMDLNTAKSIIDWVVNNRNKKIKLGLIDEDQFIYIYFFGGEPMLCYENVIVPLLFYIKEQYKNIKFKFGITTNGTLLTKEKIDFLKQNNFSLLLSIDGDKLTQDYNRPFKNENMSSFDYIFQNIPYLLENFPDLYFRSTIYPDTVEHLYENYLFAEKIGFKHWVAIEDNRDTWSDKQLIILEEEINKIFFHRLIQILNNQIPIDEPRFTTWIQNTIKLNSDKSLSYYSIEKQTNLERCGLGTNAVAIGYNGNIYGCQEQVSQENKSIFLIGNIFDKGINIEKHMNLLKIYFKNQIEQKEKFDKCKNCDLNQLCKVNVQSCPSTNIDLFNDMNSITEIGCKIKKIYYKNCLIFIKILSLFQDNENIQLFLNNILEKEGE